MTYKVGTRVRQWTDPDVPGGTGEIVALVDRGTTRPAYRVRWDGNGFSFSSTEEEKNVVPCPIVCSYTSVTWRRGKKWGVDGMVIICDVHGVPGASELYDVPLGEEHTVTARCQGPWNNPKEV